MSGDEDNLIAKLRRFWPGKSGVTDRATCLDEVTLSLYQDGQLSGAALSAAEAHLAACTLCLEELVAGSKAAQSAGSLALPAWLVERAMALVPQQETLFDLSVRLLRRAVELVSTSGQVVPLLRPVMRGQAQPVEASALQVEQTVGRFKIAVEIDVGDSNNCQVVTNVAEESGAPAEGVRLTLNSGAREQASFLTRAGLVVFDRVAPGEYSIAVSESDKLIGRIRLNLMLEK